MILSTLYSPRPKPQNSIFSKNPSSFTTRVLFFLFVFTAIAFFWKLSSRSNPNLIVIPTSQHISTVAREDVENLEGNRLDKLIEVIISSLERLDFDDAKLDEVRHFLSTLDLELCDKYGFQIVHELRDKEWLRWKFQSGQISASDIVAPKKKEAPKRSVKRKRTSKKGQSAAKFGSSFSSAPEVQIKQPEKILEPKEILKSPKNLLLTTYFVTQRDPNHPDTPMNLSMPAIEDFLETTQPFFHKMHAVVFIDFQNPPENSGIEFVYTEWKEVKYSINDYRYFLYLDYINSHDPYEQILIVDMKDVKYGRDPWEYFENSDKNIFIGSEPEMNIVWMKRRQRKCWGKGYSSGPQAVVTVMEKIRNHRPKKPLYIMTNAGILGGSTNEIVPIVEEMVDIFKTSDQNYQCNSNMVVFAGCIYPRWRDGKVETGQPLHSPFKKFYDPSPEFVFFHK